MYRYATRIRRDRDRWNDIHPDREYAYGPARGLPDSKVGTFTQALYDEAVGKGWTVVSMKTD